MEQKLKEKNDQEGSFDQLFHTAEKLSKDQKSVHLVRQVSDDFQLAFTA